MTLNKKTCKFNYMYILGVNMKILFSLLGMSDPIKNNYDGPMLHLVRKIMPDLVYLFETKEIKEIDDLDNRYQKAIESMSDEIEVKKIVGDIEKVHIYDEVSKPLKKAYTEVCEAHRNDDIYINLTSGTQQMTSILSLLVVTLPYKVKTYQINTPLKKSNSNRDDLYEYKIDEEIRNNFDEFPDLDTNTRLHELNLLSYRKSLIYSQVKYLTHEQYDYSGAYSLICNANFNTNSRLKALLNLGKYRLLLNKKKSNNYIKTLKIDDLNYYQDNNLSNLIEYLMIIRIKYLSNNFSEMVLMLEPFTVNLFETFIKKVLLKQNEYRNFFEGNKIKGEKIKNYNVNLYNKINQEFNNYIDTRPNVSLLLLMIKFFLSDCNQEYNDFIQLAEKLSNLKTLRNEIAHELRTTNLSEIEDKINCKCEYLLKEIIRLMSFYYGISKKYFNIYDIINKCIDQEVNNEL